MTPTKSVEDMNVAIANFMGKTVYPRKDTPEYKNWKGNRHDYEGFELKYHESWGWLMPVVEKISTVHFPDYYGTRGKTEDDGDWDDCAYPRTFGMRDNEGNYMVRINASVLITAPTLMEAAYLAVYDFVTWYNQQNKTV
jgi:hypothetical protein